MRARLIVAACVLAAGCAACSDQPKETGSEASAPRELAMPGSSGQAVASEIEVNAPAPPAPAPVQTRAHQAEVPPAPTVTAGTSTATLAPDPDAAATTPQPVASSAAPQAGEATQPATTHEHAPQAVNTSGPVDGGVDGTLPADNSRGPMIMIRGGGMNGNDPCIVHGRGGPRAIPGLIGGLGQPGGPDAEGPTMVQPGGGAMVNERAPRPGIGKNPIAPSTPSGGVRGVGGGTRSVGGMGGGRTRGGIR